MRFNKYKAKIKKLLSMRNSSVKWGHLENLDLELNKHNPQQTQFSPPTLWDHLAHFEPNSTNTIFSTNPMGSSSTL